jgi:nucleoporin GLE1
LAQVTFNLLETLEHFPSIFFAKLVQRCGGWPIPIVVPQVGLDGKPWASQDVHRQVCGFRKSESGEGIESSLEYSNRVSSIMRIYFNVLKIRPMRQPLDPMFQLPRYWTWFARIVGDPNLLADPIAPQLIYSKFP